MSTVASPSYRNRLAYHATLLGGICYLMSMLLIGSNLKTQPLIEAHLETDKRAMLAQVLPSSMYDNNPLAETYQLEDPDAPNKPVTAMVARSGNQMVGAALLATQPGWGGEIQFIVGVDASGEITGVRVISHKETPGLADKIEIEKDDWITSFNGRSLRNTPQAQWAVKKDQGDFDQFTGATITPRAMVDGVFKTLTLYKNWEHSPLSSSLKNSLNRTEALENSRD